jgi:L-lactate dehydrogenase complex protein LldG
LGWGERFVAELSRVGGQVHQVGSDEEACRLVVELARQRGVKRVVCTGHADLAALGLAGALAASGVEVTEARLASEEESRQELRRRIAEADLCLSGADYAVAETGTLVLLAGADNPRTATVLPPVHVAVIRPECIVPTFEDLSVRLRADHPDGLPSAITFITGPSRTADIEQTAVIGVHGPGELHVVICP